MYKRQALTRARYITGSNEVAVHFNRIRQEVLCRHRDPQELAAELLEMRGKMNQEHQANARIDVPLSPKHRPGGLIDIEFIAQLGVLTSARLYSRVIQAVGTLPQLYELKSIGWLAGDDHSLLEQTVRQLRQNRMMSTLVRDVPERSFDTEPSAGIFRKIFGDGSSTAD